MTNTAAKKLTSHELAVAFLAFKPELPFSARLMQFAGIGNITVETLENVLRREADKAAGLLALAKD